ncbi:MAG: metallophosphoesterase [Actinomycetota bacterium]
MPLRRTLRRAALAAPALGVLLYAREVEPRWIQVTCLELVLPRLSSSFDGYRIVQVGDLHLDEWNDQSRLRGIVERVNALSADLVALTGDFASYSTRRLDEAALIGSLQSLEARDGVAAVLGNHDYLADARTVRRCLRASGVTELSNDHITLRRGREELHVAGVDDVMEGRCRLDLLLERLPDSGAAVLLAHEPDFADVAAATGRFDLQLSGHSHGGQVRVPLLRRLVLPPFSQRYTAGLHRVGGMLQYTNRGLGFVHGRLRLFCRPEITALTLRSPPTGEGAVIP